MKISDFADEHDIRAFELCRKLQNAGAFYPLFGGDDDSWVKVPRKDVILFSLQFGSGEPDQVWTGNRWVDVLTYENYKGRLFARLPRFEGEILP